PHEELPLYYNAADIFVFPSLGEGWGIAPLEALACGKPVISTNVGCISEVAKDVGGIFIIPKQNSLAIKEAIIKILSSVNNVKRIDLEKLRKYDWDNIIMRTITIYEKVLEK
ncbi:MAG: glycosyltransferase family 4 protein, partial [Candidatus Bathyarchaeia archaeon]